MPDQTTGEKEREPIDVHGVIAMTIDQFAAIAWQKMGLQPDFMTGRIEKDIVQCKVAIDATVALAHLIEGQLEDEDRRQMQNLIRDLRINFVEHSK